MLHKASIDYVSRMRAVCDIEPIGSTIGAEIHGLDLSRQIDRETATALEQALIQHKVIYARDQHITTAQHVVFGRWLLLLPCVKQKKKKTFRVPGSAGRVWSVVIIIARSYKYPSPRDGRLARVGCSG